MVPTTSEPARPSISAIVTTYQRRDYVQRAVESALAQTYRDFEVIVVDDGSTDGTEQALVGVDSRLRYQWQENRGVSAARNAGLRLASGEIVAFLDSDDRWLPGHLETVAEVFVRHPEVVLVTTCPNFQIGGRQRATAANVFDALPATLGENLVGSPSCVAIRRRDLSAVSGFDERLPVMEGSELWPRLAARGSFATLQRRTVVCQATRGSLVDRARKDGSYIKALELVGLSGLATVAGLQRPDRKELMQRARGRQAYTAALRGLAGHDDLTVANELREACRLLPELSREPIRVASRLSYLTNDPDERLHQLTTAARVWPDRRSDTALFLRARAAAGAIRAGRLRPAAAMLRNWPLAPTPGFVYRMLPAWARLVRAAGQRRRHRGRETAEFDAR